MKSISLIAPFLVALALAPPLSADELDARLAELSKFNDGDDPGALKWIEERAVDSLADPALRAVLESRLLAALPAVATRRRKDFICRMLRIAGTRNSIPVLEKMLPDRENSHMARYVLGSMRTDAATAALHRSLKVVPDEVKPGIVDSLGDLRYKPATSEIIGLLETKHSGDSAARALGLIGGQASSGALKAMLDVKKGKSRQIVLNALLRCAESFAKSGDERAALDIYQGILDRESETHLAFAALKGVVNIKTDAAVPMLIATIKGGNRELANGAAGLIASIEGNDIGQKLKSLLESAPPDTQELLIGSLASRRDRSAAPEITRLLQSESPGVRFAAIQGLGQLGDASAVKPLARIAASVGHERNIARTALAALDADGVSESLREAIAGASPDLQGELARAIVARATPSTIDDLFGMAKSDSSEVRKEALRGLGRLASESHLVDLIGLLLKPKDAADRGDIESAIAYVLRRVKDPEKQVAPLLGALTLADSESKASLLALLGRIPNPSSLAALRVSLGEKNGGVQRAAIDALSKWPDFTPGADLLAIASQSDNPNRRAALDCYVTLAAKADDPATAYDRALKIASTPGIAKQVLAGLGDSGDARALALVEPHLSKPETRDEAAVAAAKIARRIKDSDAAAARATVTMILDSGASPSAMQGAAHLQSEFDQFADYILDWEAAGPYSVEGKDAKYVFDHPHAPEAAPESVKWRKIKKGISAWSIQFDPTFGTPPNSAAYSRTRIWSPEAVEVNLEMGSDDAVKVWLDGKEIHGWFGSRGVSPRQAIVPVRLNKGWNALVMKVVNVGGGWGFACRVRGRNGAAIDDLKFEAK